MLQFDWPWLFLLTPLPYLVWRFVPAIKRESAALYMPFFRNLPFSAQTQNSGVSRPKLLLLAVIWLLALAATAGPHWIGEAIQLPSSGRNLMLAVDISGSMQVEDMVVKNQRVTRLRVVKNVVGEFVEQRGGDKLGLILFGSKAYLQTPLTFDRNTLQQLLDEAQIGFAGEKTAIGDALGLAVKRLRSRDDSSRILILLTDGANTAGEIAPRQAASLAKQAGIRIYTIGMGADEMVTPGIFGTGFGARRTNPSSELDEKTLQFIADETGGRYFRARNPEQLREIYAELDRLEPVEQDSQFYRPRRALYYWPLATALLLASLWGVVSLWQTLGGNRSNRETTTRVSI